MLVRMQSTIIEAETLNYTVIVNLPQKGGGHDEV